MLIQRKMEDLQTLFEKNNTLLQSLHLTNGHTIAPATSEDFSEFEQAIVTALATLAAVNVYTVPRQWLAIVARISPKSSGYRAALASLLRRGLVEKGTSTKTVKASPKLVAVPENVEMDWSEIMHRFVALAKKPEADILYQLMLYAYDNKANAWMDRKTLAEKAKQNLDSSSFRDRITQLKAYGFVEYGQDSTVRAMIQWFYPAKKAKA